VIVYIGFCVICVGTVLAILKETPGYRTLDQDWQERLSAVGVGLIGLGTALSFWPITKDFRKDHSTFATVGFVLFGVVALGVVAIFLVLPRVLNPSQDHCDHKEDGKADGVDDCDRAIKVEEGGNAKEAD
jgi:membrane protease YdiL (CAAX protease family)